MNKLLKYTPLIYIALFVNIALGQNSNDTIYGEWTSVNTNINQSRYNFLKPYIDSLNFLENDEPLPYFLNNFDFDQKQFPFTWCIACDDIVSIRKCLLDSVSNVNTLNRILESGNPFYQSKYIPYLARFGYENLPYEDYTLKELVKLRIDEISKKE